jgi:hypothetical protein
MSVSLSSSKSSVVLPSSTAGSDERCAVIQAVTVRTRSPLPAPTHPPTLLSTSPPNHLHSIASKQPPRPPLLPPGHLSGRPAARILGQSRGYSHRHHGRQKTTRRYAQGRMRGAGAQQYGEPGVAAAFALTV